MDFSVQYEYTGDCEYQVLKLHSQEFSVELQISKDLKVKMVKMVIFLRFVLNPSSHLR